MTRTAKTLISALAVIAVSVGIGSSASAYYSIDNPPGDRSAATIQATPGSPNAVLGEQGQPSPRTTPGSPNAVLGFRRAAVVQGDELALRRDGSKAEPFVADLEPTTPTPRDGFDWGDALVGAGVALCLALMTALGLGTARRRTRFEPRETRLEPSA